MQSFDSRAPDLERSQVRFSLEGQLLKPHGKRKLAVPGGEHPVWTRGRGGGLGAS